MNACKEDRQHSFYVEDVQIVMSLYYSNVFNRTSAVQMTLFFNVIPYATSMEKLLKDTVLFFHCHSLMPKYSVDT